MILFEEKDDRFYIKKSTIENAGLGLFAKTKIKKHSYLEISGILVKRESIADQCTNYANSYKFAAKVTREGELINIGEYLIVPMGYAGIVNHSSENNVEIKYLRDYIKRNQHSGEAVYWFIKDVEPDEEILGNYGDAWNGLLDWVNKTKSEETHENWKEFLNLDLYNLGSLISI